MPNSDLISRAAALNALLMSKNYRDAHDALEQLPAVDAVPVVHGRWVKVENFVWKCSICGEEDCYAYTWGEVKRQDDLFCPHCGAKMETEISNITKKKFAPSLDDAIKEFNAKWAISGARMDGGDNK